MALTEPRDLQRRLCLPDSLGLRIASVHDAHPEQLTLPASLDRAVPKRQREYLAGRRCASEALVQAGYPQAFYPARGEDRLPIWPDGWLGSISHSGDYAIAAATTQRQCAALGIDIQEQASEKTMDAIQYLIAKPEELTTIEGLDSHAKLLLIFSAKESLYKALYPQVRKIQEFDAVKLVHAHGNTLEFELTCDWSSHWRTGMLVEVRHAMVDDYITTATYIESPTVRPASA